MSQTSAKDLVEAPLPEDIDEPRSFECRVCGDLVDPPAAVAAAKRHAARYETVKGYLGTARAMRARMR